MADDALVKGSPRAISFPTAVSVQPVGEEQGFVVTVLQWQRLKRRMRKADAPLNIWGAVASFATGAFFTAFPEMRTEYVNSKPGFYTIVGVAALVAAIMAAISYVRFAKQQTDAIDSIIEEMEDIESRFTSASP